MGVRQEYRPTQSKPPSMAENETIKRQAEEIEKLRLEVTLLKGQSSSTTTIVKTEEYERKFLVNPAYYDTIKSEAHSHYSKVQTYFELTPNPFVSEIRVSKRSDKDYGSLVIKTTLIGTHRTEWHILHTPAKETLELMALSPHRVAKNCYLIKVDGVEWKVDFFTNENAGLVIAEVEFADSESMTAFTNSHKLPHWVRREVTDEPRYYNSNLARAPWIAACLDQDDDRQEGVVSRWIRSKFH